MRWKAKVALATACALGMTVGQAHAEERLTPDQRHARVRYESLMPPQWTPTETVMTIRAAADRFHVADAVMICLAQRESGFNEDAVNSSSGAAGLFQHLRQYWPGRVRWYNARVGPYLDVHANASPFSARANSLVTALMIHRGGLSPWGGYCG